MMKAIGERHLAISVMMPVGLSVGRDVNELSLTAAFDERAEQAIREFFAARKQPAESYVLRDRPVVEEKIYRLSRRQPAQVRHARIDAAAAHVFPTLAHAPHTACLPGRK